jgi:hypothetical protein
MTRLEVAQRLYDEMRKTKTEWEADSVTQVCSGGPLAVSFRFAQRRPILMRGGLARSVHELLRRAT